MNGCEEGGVKALNSEERIPDKLGSLRGCRFLTETKGSRPQVLLVVFQNAGAYR